MSQLPLDPVNDAVKQICANVLTPFYYAGIVDKRVDKSASWFNDMFFPSSRDILHDKTKILWHELKERYPSLMPTDVCECQEGDYVSMSEYYMERTISHGHWFLGATVTCGDFGDYLGPGENPYESTNFEQQVQDHFLGLRAKIMQAFRTKHELWAVQLMTAGEIEVKPATGLPYKIQFQRSNDLNLTIDDATRHWCNAGKKGTKDCPQPWVDLQRMDDALWDKNRGRGDIVFMNKQTCDWMMMAMTDYVKECKDIGTAQFLMPTMIRAAGYELPRPVDGARFVGRFLSDREIDIYCVDTNFTFCDPDTNKDVCINPIQDGKVYMVNNNATQNNTLGGTTAYGRVWNLHNSQRRIREFSHQMIDPKGMCMDFWTQSSPTKLLECPDATVCLDVCGGSLKTAA